ncbi:translesion error-prone DNA polymerase V autoproteolytic subunit [Burkholderiaceae bacterium DAT-1]|nr:translesion error-prone DNA polymerase V autoproteolytic subunit [Burkholderiaceae bacterium DAT-1]
MSQQATSEAVQIRHSGVSLPRQCEHDVVQLIPGANTVRLPIASSKIAAGFPSPAADHMDEDISLDEILIEHPASTYFVRVKGESMKDAHIYEGDVLIVDKSLTPRHDDIVVAVLDGEMTVKRLYLRNGIVRLVPENPDFPVIDIQEGQELTVWGVVTSTIRRFRHA